MTPGNPRLSGRQREQLHGALLDAYRSRPQLARMLSYKLDVHLSVFAGEAGGLDDVVFELIEQAVNDGWVGRLIRAARQDRPDNRLLEDCARELLPTGRVPEPDGVAAGSPTEPAGSAPESVPRPVHQSINSAHFDLTELRREVERVLAGAAPGVIGFAVTYPDLVFVKKVCDWLPCCLGPTERKDPLTLKPELVPVDRQIRQVVRYRRELESTNVVCPVLAQGVPGATLGEFWRGVRDEFGSLDHWLVLIFTGTTKTEFPAGVTVLPEPRFDRVDLTLWLREIVFHRGWPPACAEAWTDLITDNALDGEGMDVRIVYETMDWSINEARLDPSGFQRRLQQRSASADSPPC